MERDRFEQIFWTVTDAGYLSFDWTCANNDRYLNNKTEEQTLTEYLLWSVEATLGSLAWTKDTPRIMLMHDVADETVEALPQILDYLIGEGYTFGTLDELEGYWVFH
jgi:peptidoglycan/xylan/chitin deacetylase (PgdA/CDA1 family)